MIPISIQLYPFINLGYYFSFQKQEHMLRGDLLEL